MRKHLHIIYWCLFSLLIFSSQYHAQNVTVKMRINTSTCLDTLKPNHMVLVCGETKLGTTPAITWDNKTGIKAVNVGGDYWEATFQAKPGDEIRYKFVTYFDLSTPTFHWDGWEGPINAGVPSGDNRLMVVGTIDTTLPLQYYNGWENKVAQYWRPFESKQDSIAIYFRVNMGGTDFDPASQKVDVRGGLPLGAADPWITIKTLSRETNSVNGGSFWSGVAYAARTAVTPGTTQQQYKFVIQPDTWESTQNRAFTFSGLNDTTITWSYFNNRPPSGPKVDANILFRVKLDALEKAGLFNEALGDRIAVTGVKGWPPTGFVFETEPSMLKLTYNSDLEEWNLVEPFSKYPLEVLEYKYFIAWDTTRVTLDHPNFIPGLFLTDGWEEPGVTGGGNRTYTYSNAAEQYLPGDFGYEQQFFNSIPPNGVIETPIEVTFKVNMAPAADVASNPTNPLFRPGVDSVFVQFDGSFVPITQGLTMYGTDNRLELLDTDGDLVYTGTWNLEAPSFYQMCYRITYSNAPGTPITNGGGVLYGRRYYQYVHPTSVNEDGTVTWPASFDLPQMEWTASDLTVEAPPALITDVEGDIAAVESYHLYQNYPNPFNPSTIIKFNLPEAGKVKLEVVDVLGKKVITLVDGYRQAGTHSVSWNASHSGASSGIYFVKMESGSYTKINKMMLIK